MSLSYVAGTKNSLYGGVYATSTNRKYSQPRPSTHMAFAAINTITEVAGRYKLGVTAALSRHPEITRMNTVKWFPLGVLGNLYNTAQYLSGKTYSEQEIFILRIFMKKKQKQNINKQKKHQHQPFKQ